MKKKRTHWQMPIKLNPILRLSLSGFSNGEVIVCVSLCVCARGICYCLFVQSNSTGRSERAAAQKKRKQKGEKRKDYEIN